MYRTNIYLTEVQRTALADRARAEGTSGAELVRRLLDAALFGAGDDLDEGLGAIHASFGALADDDVRFDRSDGAREAHLERVSHW